MPTFADLFIGSTFQFRCCNILGIGHLHSNQTLTIHPSYQLLILVILFLSNSSSVELNPSSSNATNQTSILGFDRASIPSSQPQSLETSQEPEARDTAVREAVALRRVQHPNVVRFREAWGPRGAWVQRDSPGPAPEKVNLW